MDLDEDAESFNAGEAGVASYASVVLYSKRPFARILKDGIIDESARKKLISAGKHASPDQLSLRLLIVALGCSRRALTCGTEADLLEEEEGVEADDNNACCFGLLASDAPDLAETQPSVSSTLFMFSGVLSLSVLAFLVIFFHSWRPLDSASDWFWILVLLVIFSLPHLYFTRELIVRSFAATGYRRAGAQLKLSWKRLTRQW